MENHLVTLLKRTALFGDLPASRFARLATATQELRYARGAMVFQKGEQPTGLAIVVSGNLKEACRSPGGEEKIIEVLGTGENCGEAALLAGSPYPFFILALTNSVLLHVEKPAIDELIDANPRFVHRLLRTLAERQHTILRDIEAAALSSLLQRVVGYLLDQCRECVEEMPSFILPASKQVIASRLGMTPAALSRALRDLTDAGLIEVGGKRVVLRDPDRLREFAR